MNFVSLSFLLFLFVAAVCYYVMPKITRPFWMLACSYTFYLYDPENAPFVALLLGMTAATYLLGLLIQICPVKPVQPSPQPFSAVPAFWDGGSICTRPSSRRHSPG